MCRVEPAPSASRTLNIIAQRAAERAGPLAVDGRVLVLPRRFEDDYVLDGDQLGDGYNGEVVGATNRATGTRRAVKTFNCLESDRLDSIMSEVEAALCMDHPHIVRVSEVYGAEKTVQMVMERLEGGELFTRVVDSGFLAECTASDFVRQMLLALNYMHKQGVAHRDVKLENFMFTESGGSCLKLIDFGFAKFFDKSGGHMADRLGTMRYVAPEVIAKDYVGGSCDMWSLGVVVFAMLSGHLPFDQKLPGDIAKAIVNGSYSLSTGRLSVASGSARSFVRSLLTVSPTKRMTAAEALFHPWIADYVEYSGEDALRLDSYVAEAFVAFAHASPVQRRLLRVVAQALTGEERVQLEQAFIDFDHSNSGTLFPGDLKRLLPRNSDARRLLDGLEDLDRPIHCSDFVAAMISVRPRTYEACMREAFHRFDMASASAWLDAPAVSPSTSGKDTPEGTPSSADDLVAFVCMESKTREDALGAPPLVSHRGCRRNGEHNGDCDTSKGVPPVPLPWGMSSSTSASSRASSRAGARRVDVLTELAELIVNVCGPAMLCSRSPR